MIPLLLSTTAPLTAAPILSLDSLASLLTLTALEIVLGIDNVVFVAILVGKLPQQQRDLARRLGMGLAMGFRVLLLLAIGWVMGLTAPLLQLPAFWTSASGDVHAISGRDLILLAGGLFLVGKATFEIHDKLEGAERHEATVGASFAGVLVQLVLLDLVFSLDSVITAVGMAQHLPIMIAAIVIAVGIMLLFSASISAFVERHPTMKVLALSFLILIGVMLVIESLHQHIPKGYIYFAMAFALGVELLNLRLRRKATPVHLRQTYVPTAGKAEP